MQKRDFIYVTDVARAFHFASESKRERVIYNLGGGSPQSINYLVELLKGTVDYLPSRPGEPKVTWANIGKIQTDLNWMPEVSFEAGVGIMLENIKDWANAPLWNKKTIATATKSWFKYLR